ncbi:diacylglycerol kinase family protein [Candidatus Amesbacteria bacterium]|nr:diacylglycerol kinase family protein [Candidatus Amesbacteria bacterium]
MHPTQLFNSSLSFRRSHYCVDLLTDQYHLNAKIAKDVAAAAMLVYALGAVVLAAIIFIPKLWPSI